MFEYTDTKGWTNVAHGLDLSVYKIIALTPVYNTYYYNALARGVNLQFALPADDTDANISLYHSQASSSGNFNTILQITYMAK